MVYFSDYGMYLESRTSLLEKIQAIDVIIASLMNVMTTVALNAGTDEYMLNDGQTIIKTKYRDPNQVLNTINALRRLQNIYLKDYNQTGVVRAMDNKNFYPRKFQ